MKCLMDWLLEAHSIGGTLGTLAVTPPLRESHLLRGAAVSAREELDAGGRGPGRVRWH